MGLVLEKGEQGQIREDRTGQREPLETRSGRSRVEPGDLLKYGLIPEFVGRLPVLATLEDLDEAALKKILTEPQNALLKQYKALLATEGVTVDFTEDAIDRLAQRACDVNAQTENIGARRLHTLLEKLLEDLSFDAPELEEKQVTIDAAYVEAKLAEIAVNRDLSQFVL